MAEDRIKVCVKLVDGSVTTWTPQIEKRRGEFKVEHLTAAEIRQFSRGGYYGANAPPPADPVKPEAGGIAAYGLEMESGEDAEMAALAELVTGGGDAPDADEASVETAEAEGGDAVAASEPEDGVESAETVGETGAMTRAQQLVAFLRENGPTRHGEIHKQTGIPKGTLGMLLSGPEFEKVGEGWTVKA